MHLLTTSALLALYATSGLAAPYSNDGALDQQNHGQLPFLAGPLKDAGHGDGRIQTTASEYLPSLESFHSVLGQDDYDKLAEHVASLPERRIIALSERREDVFEISEGQKALLTFHGIQYMDITDDVPSLEQSNAAATIQADISDAAFSSNWTYGRHELEKNLYSKIDTSRMKSFLKAFSSFRTRYYRSGDGRQSQLFLLEKIREIVSAKKNKHLRMSVEEFPHSWGQNSLIVKLPANGTEEAQGTIVVGAHQDSTNLLPFLSAPGADDDGSGTTTVMEVLHILTESGYIPQSHNVEFHFYSAEEGGMLGSNAVVNDYQQRVKKAVRGERVKAMLQMDMTAYVKPGTQERIGIIQDFVSPSLTKFVTRLIDQYNDIPSVETACKYACSDHSSWTRIGVPSAFAIEATFEDSNTRHIHTSGDTIEVEGFSFDHMAQFVKLASAFVMELAA